MAVKITANGIDTIQDNIVNGNKIQDGTIAFNDLPGGSIIQVVHRYDDTVSAAGSGSPNATYWLDTYITLKKSNSKIIIEGVWTGHSADDSSLQLQWNLNGGGWNTDTQLNSRAYSYSGLADFTWTHRSNNGPFPVSLSNYLNCSNIGASAGSTVGIRVCCINENGTTFYNRGTDGQDNSVNYATARSRMTLMEVIG